ncbi:MAG: MarR family winged helix-turn-helix transcriptional regulator [Bacillus sp. (in: firmicutes)]
MHEKSQQFYLLFRSFENELNVLLAKHNLSRAQWTIMYHLFNLGTSTRVELSKYQNVEKPTITRTISRMDEAGLIENLPSNDKRKKKIQLTIKGKEEVARKPERIELTNYTSHTPNIIPHDRCQIMLL